MRVEEQIRTMTFNELVDFFKLFNREWLDDYFCINICPCRNNNQKCKIVEEDKCNSNDEKLIEWFLKQDYDEIISILTKYKENSTYDIEL